MLSFYVNISWPWFASEFFKTDSSPSAYISWLSQPHISINTSALHLQVLIYPFNIIHTKVTIMDNIKEQFTFHTTSSISAVYLSTVNFMYDNARNLSITTLDLHQRIFLLTWSHTEFNGVWIWMQIQLHNCFFFFWFPMQHRGAAGSNSDFSVPVPTPTTSQWMHNNAVLLKMNTMPPPPHFYNYFNSLHKITFLFI